MCDNFALVLHEKRHSFKANQTRVIFFMNIIIHLQMWVINLICWKVYQQLLLNKVNFHTHKLSPLNTRYQGIWRQWSMFWFKCILFYQVYTGQNCTCAKKIFTIMHFHQQNPKILDNLLTLWPHSQSTCNFSLYQ